MVSSPTRWSHPFLEVLEQVGSRLPCPAFRALCRSESSIPTICMDSPSLSFTDLQPYVRKYNWNSRITEGEWEMLVSSTSPSKRHKLYHALKF